MKTNTTAWSQFLTAVLAVLGGAVSAAFSATIHIPADQPTIQAGINAAANGDTVLVAAGTYRETINFMGKAITVASASGPRVTIIDGSSVGGPVVRFVMAETSKAVLRGFTIQGGTLCCFPYEGGGIEVNNSSPSIIGNVIQNNVGAGNGGGINIYFGSPLVRGNTINGNSVAFSGGTEGGGIDILGSSSAQIVGNSVTANFGVGFGGGIGLNGGSNAVIRNNRITGNTAESEGGGIWLANNSDEIIVQNLIAKNTAPSGSGIYSLIPSSAPGFVVVNNTIANNSTSDAAFVADGFNSNVQIINNLIIALPKQTALLCNPIYTDGPPIVHFNDAFSSLGTAYGGMCSGFTGTNGNISASPNFVLGTYRLNIGSPAIDVGTNSAPDLTMFDLAGKPRIVDVDGDGNPVIDMGAFEFQ